MRILNTFLIEQENFLRLRSLPRKFVRSIAANRESPSFRINIPSYSITQF